jgi:hypothetical protein
VVKPAENARARRRRARIVCACTALALLATAPVASADEPVLVVSPRPAQRTGLSYFRLTLHKGHQALAGTIELHNPSSNPVRVTLAAVDGRTLGTLGSTYSSPRTRAHGSTRWLRLGARKVTIAPHSSVAVQVVAAAPKKAKPGDYLSGISIEQLGQGATTSSAHGLSIASVVRYAIGVEVTVPGKRHPSIVFTGASLQRQPLGPVFMLLARNRGNVILQGVRGSALITRGSRVVARLPLGPGTFVSHTAIEYPVPAYGERPSEGARYRVRAVLRYKGGIARLDTDVTFGHAQAVIQRSYQRGGNGHGGTAWWKITGIALLAAYCVGTSALLLRKRRTARGGPSAA